MTTKSIDSYARLCYSGNGKGRDTVSEAERLIQALERKQIALSLSDAQMAERLGVSRPLWTRVRLRDYTIERSALFIGGVIRGFPEFSVEAFSVLRGNATTMTEAVTKESEAAVS